MREHVIDGMRCVEAGAGWPVVLIHGFPLSADMWRPQLARVPDGWRYIAPDLRGFGASSGLEPGRPAPHMLMDDYARDVVRLLDRLEIENATIGGLSMGGYVTFALFRLAPERFTGMILADTRAQADSAEGRAARQSMRTLVAARGPSAVADQMLPKLFSADAEPDAVAQVRAIIEGTPAATIDAALGALMDRPDSTPDLPRMSCPTIVIVGERDEITPVADAERMQRLMPRSRLAVIPGAGHLSNVERPAEFARALHDFLVAAM
jgi:3-oxoadipate enol-lactonase